MSSNKTLKSGSSKPGTEVVKQEDVTIAVLVADSFSTRFAPVTASKPKVRFFKLQRYIHGTVVMDFFCDRHFFH